MTSTGKRYRPRPYRITFEPGHEFENLEVHARRMSVDDLMRLISVADLAQEVSDGSAGEITDRHKEAVEVMFAAMADAVTWWNVDRPAAGQDEGDPDCEYEPVIPDEAGMRSQDFAMVMAVFTAYFQRVTSVAPPLPGGSSGGPNQEALASIPTEPLPPGPPS